MARQALKFEFQGSLLKIFFRYPDRTTTGRLSDEEKALIQLEDEAIEFKRSLIVEILANSPEVSTDDIEEIVFKKTIERTIPIGTGPITTEFHIVEETDVKNGKSVYKEFNKPSKVKFHPGDAKNCYEKARQYAIYKYFEENKVEKDSELYNLIIDCYQTRSEYAIPFCKDRDDIEKINSSKSVKVEA